MSIHDDDQQAIERDLDVSEMKTDAWAAIIIAVLLAISLLWYGTTHAQTATFTASKTSGEFPISTTLTWNVPGAASCIAGSTPGWNGSVPTSGTRNLSGIGVDMTLTLSCKAADGAGSTLLTWERPTTNTDGSALTDLAGFTILQGASASALSSVLQLNVPTATAYNVTPLAPGTYAFAVRARTTDGRESANSNVVTKTVAGTPGAALPVLSVAIDGHTLPAPPTNLTATDPIAFEIKPNSTGALVATRIGLVPLGTTCSEQQQKIGTVTYHKVPRSAVDMVNWPGNVKLQDVWARCS